MENIHPILSCKKAQDFEKILLQNDVEKSYQAMTDVGENIAKMLWQEFALTIGDSPKILILSGTGHNGGDAILTVKYLCTKLNNPQITVVISSENKLKENTKRAISELKNSAKIFELLPNEIEKIVNQKFDLILDGILGMSYTPPLREETVILIEKANSISAKLRVAIDIPSGASTTPSNVIFKADATYATGICKDVLFEDFNREFVGRIRYVDIGFFDSKNDFSEEKNFIVSPKIFNKLKTLRPAISDKRTFGHLFVIAGSQTYPGAVLLAVKSALRSGVGLVSAFVPESLAPMFASAEPSAIWTGCPEDENGAIALESLGMIRARLNSATAILAGCGMTQSAETKVLLAEVLKLAPDVPIVLDADAITQDLAKTISTRNVPVLLTPHEGEILRLAPDASDESLIEVCKKYNCTITLKSSATRICNGQIIVRQTRGCPALARAGSGDILAGLCGGLMANKSLQFENRALQCGVIASQWLGIASELIASERGEVALATSDIINYLYRIFQLDF